MAPRTSATMAELIEQDRIRLESKKIDTDQMRLQKVQELGMGLLILAGCCFAMWMVMRVAVSWADSDLTDALQECGRVRVEDQTKVSPSQLSPANDLIVKCRDQVFEHFKEIGS